MKLRVYEYREWADQWLVTNEINVSNNSGSHSINISYINAMSDRCYAFQPDDSRAWAYDVYLSVTVNFTLNVDQTTNRISVNVGSWSNWAFHRVQGPTPAGYGVVRGNYQWYSTQNGAELYHYIGPGVSGQGNLDVAVGGYAAPFSINNIMPETETGKTQFSRIHNNVNGINAYAYLAFYNDLPQDYRPGERNIGGTWYSLNRAGGVCERNNSWYEMRTVGGNAGAQGDPPERKIGNTWTNMSRTGVE